jgi:BspA type Leucine rich repeat region (6 copies)
LTSVTIPPSVTTIGAGVFAGCVSLQIISFGGSSITNISDQTFIYCTKLETINLLNSTTAIENKVFAGCVNLTTMTNETNTDSGVIYIPQDVTSIGDYTFENCISITTVFMFNNVTSIGQGSFFNCISLSQITLSSDLPPYNSIVPDTSLTYREYWGIPNTTTIIQ